MKIQKTGIQYSELIDKISQAQVPEEDEDVSQIREDRARAGRSPPEEESHREKVDKLWVLESMAARGIKYAKFDLEGKRYKKALQGLNMARIALEGLMKYSDGR